MQHRTGRNAPLPGSVHLADSVADGGSCTADADGKCGLVGGTETLGYRPTVNAVAATGTYEIEVHPADDSVNLNKGGPFRLDLSFGALAGAAGGGDPGGDPGGVTVIVDTDQSATTNNGGKYGISDVPTGDHATTASKDG